jgi:hypothetical protein
MKIDPVIFQKIESECRIEVLKFIKHHGEFVISPFSSFISMNKEALSCAIFWDSSKKKQKDTESYFDDYLGVYEYQKSGQFEGLIKIFAGNILSFVKVKHAENKLYSKYNRLEFFKSVCRVVLFHELSHWLVHNQCIRLDNAITNEKYSPNSFAKMSTFQNEQWAQILTAAMLTKKIDWYTFGFLMSISGEQYKLESELLHREPSEYLCVLYDFINPPTFSKIKDERPFSEVFFSHLKKENHSVNMIKGAIDLNVI